VPQHAGSPDTINRMGLEGENACQEAGLEGDDGDVRGWCHKTEDKSMTAAAAYEVVHRATTG
jgi:hypothetical protein